MCPRLKRLVLFCALLAPLSLYAQWFGGAVSTACIPDTLAVSHSVSSQKPTLERLREFEGNGLQLKAPSSLTGATRDVVFDRLDRMWIAEREGGLHMFDGSEFHRFDIPGVQALMDLSLDDEGRLWLATEGAGIVCYDGQHFLRYLPGADGGVHNFVYLLHLDQGGIAAASFEHGVLLLLANETRHYNEDAGLPSNAVMGLAQADDGALWTGHWFGGWARISDKVTAFTDLGLPENARQRLFFPGPDGTGWICAGNGVYHMQLTTSPSAHLKVPGVFAYCAVKQNNDWHFGTSNNGLVTLKANGEIQQRSNAQGLPSDRVSAVVPDSFGNVWLGFFEATGGVLALLPELVEIRSEKDGLPNATVLDTFWDSQGRLWTTYNGGRIARSTDNGDTFTAFTLPGDEKVNVVCMQETPDGDLWFAASNEGVYRLRGEAWTRFPYATQKKGSRFLTTMLYAHGKLWCGGLGGLYVVEDGALQDVLNAEGKKVIASTASDLMEDSRGNLWATTASGDIHCIPFLSALGTQTMHSLFVRPDSTWHYSTGLRLHAIAESKAGNMWIASDGAGVFGFDPSNVWDLKDGETTVYTSFEQADTSGYLGGANAYAFVLDLDHNLWATTSTGLVKWSVHDTAGNTGIFAGYTPQVLHEWHGLRSASFDEDAGGSIAPDGALWLGLKKGLLRLERGMVYPESSKPKAFISRLNAMGHPVNWQSYKGAFGFRTQASNVRSYFPNYVQYEGVTPWSKLPINPTFSFDQNELEFELGAHQWGQTTSLEYRFRTAASEAWTPYRENSIASFNGLQPGDYLLEYQARDAAGKESDVAHFAFTVQNPVWRTAAFIVASALVFFLLVVLVYRLRVQKIKKENRVLEEKVDERTEELRVEKKKSDDLLLNILPRSTAEELKENGKAKTQSYPSCSVLFSDFKGFTQLTETVDSHYLVEVLDRFFQAFDKGAVHFGLEKIKTIGDAYMCASGLPHPSEEHAARLVAFGLEMLTITARINAELVAAGSAPWPIRIGIHSGPVIAGVVGKNKFAYDIWGDTVNTASRMESSGEPGKLNISGQTAAEVSTYFELEPRGAIAAKNKGDLNMFFVTGFHRPFAASGNPHKPNADFARAIKQNVVYPSEL